MLYNVIEKPINLIEVYKAKVDRRALIHCDHKATAKDRDQALKDCISGIDIKTFTIAAAIYHNIDDRALLFNVNTQIKPSKAESEKQLKKLVDQVFGDREICVKRRNALALYLCCFKATANKIMINDPLTIANALVIELRYMINHIDRPLVDKSGILLTAKKPKKSNSNKMTF